MAVSYNKLFKLLIDKKMKKKELCELAGVSISTIGKMGRLTMYWILFLMIWIKRQLIV